MVSGVLLDSMKAWFASTFFASACTARSGERCTVFTALNIFLERSSRAKTAFAAE
ncbi:hypothetical protein D3C75_1202780 [compost metagenome]